MSHEISLKFDQSRILHRERTPKGLFTVRTFSTTVDSLSRVTELVHRAYAAHETPGEPNKFRQTTQSNAMTLEHMAHGVTLLAEVDGNPAIKDGLAAITTYYPPKELTGAPHETHPDASTFNEKRTAEWGFLAIDPAAKGLNLTRRLYTYVDAMARADDVQVMGGRAREDATGVRALYAALGFEDVVTTLFPEPWRQFPIVIIKKPMEGTAHSDTALLDTSGTIFVPTRDLPIHNTAILQDLERQDHKRGEELLVAG